MAITRRSTLKALAGAAAFSLRPLSGFARALQPAAAEDRRLENLQQLFLTGIVVDSLSGFRPDPASADHGFGAIRESGVTIVSTTLGAVHNEEAFRLSVASIAETAADIARYAGRMTMIRNYADVERAKKENKLGEMINFQDSVAIGTDLKNLDFFYRLGLRQIQLTFNYRNWVGDGCTERTQAGLSNFGIDLVQKMNDLGVIVDVAHSGYQTTLDAVEASRKPIIYSHTNCKALCDHPRNKTDDQIKALAAKGGVMGISTFNWFVSDRPRSNLEDLLKHFDHAVKLVGPDHVGIGTDFELPLWPGKEPDAEWEAHRRIYSERDWKMLKGRFPPYIEEVNTPRRYWIIAEGLQKRGYALSDIQKILGLNFVRIYKEVLKA